jgi:hypothetical protein
MCVYVYNLFPFEILRAFLFITMNTKAKRYFGSTAVLLFPFLETILHSYGFF